MGPVLVLIASLPLPFQSVGQEEWFSGVEDEVVSIGIEEFREEPPSSPTPSASGSQGQVAAPPSQQGPIDSTTMALNSDSSWCIGLLAQEDPTAPCGPEQAEASEVVSSGTSAASDEVVATFARDNIHVVIDAGQIDVQPAGGEVLINKPVYFEATAQSQAVGATVLGRSVSVRAHPFAYTWDFGDGTILTTNSPGGSWPDGDVTHAYTRPTRVAPTVTTAWNVSVSFDGQEWIAVPGEGRTTASAAPFTVIEAQSVLHVPPR